MLQHDGYNIRPLSYVRFSGIATIEYLEGPQQGIRKDVPWDEITHEAGEAEVAKLLRNVRKDA